MEASCVPIDRRVQNILPLYTHVCVYKHILVKNAPADAGNSGEGGWILGWEDPLEEEMATHSSTLAWRIPWTEEPGRLQSMGSQRGG